MTEVGSTVLHHCTRCPGPVASLQNLRARILYWTHVARIPPHWNVTGGTFIEADVGNLKDKGIGVSGTDATTFPDSKDRYAQ